MSNEKDTTIHLIVGLIKKTLNESPRINMTQYFPKPFKSFVRNINVRVDLLNYATKTDFKKYNTHWYLKFCTKNKFS